VGSRRCATTSLIPQRPPAVIDFVGRGCSISEVLYACAVACASDIVPSYVSVIVVISCMVAAAGSIVVDLDLDLDLGK